VRFRKVLAAGQIGMSLVLLTAAVLFGRTLYNLKTVDSGYSIESLITFSIDPALNGYSPAQVRSTLDRMQDALAGMPGVRSASSATLRPLSRSEWRSTVNVEGYEAKPDEDMSPVFNSVGVGYFRTMGIPLLIGRDFTLNDDAGAQKVGIINQAMARYYFGNADPVGRRFGIGRNKPDIEIIGVVGNGKNSNLRLEAPRTVYTPYRQSETVTGLTFFARTSGDANWMANAIRREAAAVDPTLPVYDMKTMERQVDELLYVERALASLSVFFAVVASALAAVGLYGVMAFTVARRTREIGIRMALGAGRRHVLSSVLREVAVVAAAGIAVAAPLALALGRYVSAQVYGVRPTDPVGIAAAAGLIAIIALTAGYLPAARASRVDPLTALRHD
jgi:predicted permease